MYIDTGCNTNYYTDAGAYTASTYTGIYAYADSYTASTYTDVYTASAYAGISIYADLHTGDYINTDANTDISTYTNQYADAGDQTDVYACAAADSADKSTRFGLYTDARVGNIGRSCERSG